MIILGQNPLTFVIPIYTHIHLLEPYTVPLKRNIASTHEQAFAHTRIIANKRGVAHFSLTSVHVAYKRGVAHVLLVCHTPFNSDYSRTSKCLLMSTREIALERYRTTYYDYDYD